MRPEDRRGEILEAALAVFAEMGFANASLNDVAERVGVTKGCLYHHFPSKEELLLELMRSRCAAVTEAGTTRAEGADGGASPALDQLLARMWEQFRQPGRIELTKLAITELPKMPETARVLFTEGRACVRTELRAAIAEATRGRDVSPEAIEVAAMIIPQMMMGVVLGQHALKGIDPLAVSPEEIGEVVRDVLLWGIAGRSGENG